MRGEALQNFPGIGAVAAAIDGDEIGERGDAAETVVAQGYPAYFLAIGERLPSDHAVGIEERIKAAKARLSIRFNDLHSGEALVAMISAIVHAEAADGEVVARISGEAFLTPPGSFSSLISDAITAATGITPELSTTGGTSDGRFIELQGTAEQEPFSRTILDALLGLGERGIGMLIEKQREICQPILKF